MNWSLLTIKTSWYYSYVKVSKWWASRTQSPHFDPQNVPKISYLSNNGREKLQNQTKTYMSWSALTIMIFWYDLHVKVSKWQAARALSPHFDIQNGPKISYLSKNGRETPQAQTKPYMSGSLLTIKTFWYYLHLKVSKYYAARTQSPLFDPQNGLKCHIYVIMAQKPPKTR